MRSDADGQPEEGSMAVAQAQCGLSPRQVEDILNDREVVAAVDKAARRLSRRRGFVRSDDEDIRQELLKEIFLRLPSYVPVKATLIGYVHQIIHTEVQNLGRKNEAGIRDYRRCRQSLDAEIFAEDGGSTTLGQTLAQGDDRRRDHGLTDHEATELRMDVDEVLREAPVEVRNVFEGVRDGKSRSEIALEHGMTAKTVRSCLAKLRELLGARYLDWVRNRQDGHGAPSNDVSHDDRDGALAVSSRQAWLREPSPDPTLAGCVSGA
jgi:RNA polymerase sigma factor (sigma-70 family)